MFYSQWAKYGTAFSKIPTNFPVRTEDVIRRFQRDLTQVKEVQRAVYITLQGQVLLQEYYNDSVWVCTATYVMMF